jgi:uncharacterized protein YdaU (DUF1376 family)
MAKDPAFLFYPNDWLGGTMGMTFEEKGAYMDLLMLQFNRGHMTSHMVGQVIGQLEAEVQAEILAKFKIDANGLYYNTRLDIEVEKRKTFIQSRNNNILGKNQYTKSNGHMEAHMSGHVTSHMENENEDVNNFLLGSKIKEYWEKWKKYKKDEFNFNFNGEVSEEEAKKDLISLSENNADLVMEIIDYSIACGYKKFVKPEKNKKDGKSRGKQSVTTPEERATIAAETFGTNSRGNSK